MLAALVGGPPKCGAQHCSHWLKAGPGVSLAAFQVFFSPLDFNLKRRGKFTASLPFVRLTVLLGKRHFPELWAGKTLLQIRKRVDGEWQTLCARGKLSAAVCLPTLDGPGTRQAGQWRFCSGRGKAAGRRTGRALPWLFCSSNLPCKQEQPPLRDAGAGFCRVRSSLAFPLGDDRSIKATVCFAHTPCPFARACSQPEPKAHGGCQQHTSPCASITHWLPLARGGRSILPE